MTEEQAQVTILFRFLQKRPHAGRRAVVYVLWWIEALSCGHFAATPAHQTRLRKTTRCDTCLFGEEPGVLPDHLAFLYGGFNSAGARRQRQLLYEKGKR